MIAINLRSKLVGNAAIYLGANILNAAIPFFLLPILTRVLTPSDYGTVAMFGIVLGVLGAFTGLSVHGAVSIRYFQLGKEQLAQYIGTCIGIVVVSTLALIILIATFGSLLEGVTGVPANWLLVAVVLSGFQFLGNIQLSLWQVSGQAKKYGIFQVAQGMFNGGFSLIFILIMRLAWQGRVLGQAVSIIALGVVALWWLLKNKLLRIPQDWRNQCLDALNFGVPLIPHVIGGIIILTIGQFLITNMLGVAKTGIYVVAVQFGAIIGILSDAFVKSYGPWLYEKIKDESIASRLFVVGITYYVFLLFLVLAAVASLVIFLIFPFVVGKNFLPAKFLTIFFIFGNAFVGMYYAIAGFFFFTSKTKFVSIATITSGITSIFLMWILGINMGIEGVALGFLLSQILRFLLAWALTSLVYPMPWFKFRLAFDAVSFSRSKK
ncbi:MAG: oligosaccharide flippase family protein [Rhodoferax sp.]|uniref:lipopolysaccharide biosynthesis protein n=1 Tax=Rhodoferax sp. TaxID=50421 RepID=UPI002617055B|nr:oligosaccharide flippase family protein [Rhodoferax sp.]MDD5334863.1 oligosaccharide flippase family protein [Rhodoferax sp.]